jgi:hypothetical protein
LSFEFEFGRNELPSTREWWASLPTWLRLIYALVTIPAWLFIMYCVFTGQDKSTGALIAFGIAAASAVPFLIHERRRRAP